MRVLLLLLLVSVAAKLSVCKLIGYDNPTQELFLYRQKLTILYNLLDSKCPGYVRESSRREVNLDEFHLTVVKRLYNKLIHNLVDCEAELKKAASSTAATTIEVTTTTPDASTTPSINYKDCQEVYEHGYNQSGVYKIALPNLPSFNAWCDFVSGKGWTVIQRREMNGNVSFNRLWAEYKAGFGNLDGEQWLGNEKIHALTATNQRLNIQMVTRDGSQKSGYWSTFYVSDEANNYNLTVEGETGYLHEVNGFTSYHNGMAFSTSDRDNDRYGGNCAADYKGGWWYNRCDRGNLNNGDSRGMHWYGQPSPLRLSVMRVTRQ